jgi:hypothetical protein
LKREVDGAETGRHGPFHLLLEERAGLGEQWRDRLQVDAIVAHEPVTRRALVETEAQVALALVEADELGDVGRRDADAPLGIQSDGVLILKGDEGNVGDHRLRHARVPHVQVHAQDHAGVGWLGGRIPSTLAVTPWPLSHRRQKRGD